MGIHMIDDDTPKKSSETSQKAYSNKKIVTEEEMNWMNITGQ